MLNCKINIFNWVWWKK